MPSTIPSAVVFGHLSVYVVSLSPVAFYSRWVRCGVRVRGMDGK